MAGQEVAIAASPSQELRDALYSLSSFSPATRLSAIYSIRSAVFSSASVSADDADEVALVNEGEFEYALSRLLKGLTSTNDASRQGFALAFADIVSLTPHEKYGVILKEIELALNYKPAKLSKSEQKNTMFGKLFAYAALLESLKSSKDAEIINKVLVGLLELSAERPYMQYPALFALNNYFSGMVDNNKIAFNIDLVSELKLSLKPYISSSSSKRQRSKVAQNETDHSEIDFMTLDFFLSCLSTRNYDAKAFVDDCFVALNKLEAYIKAVQGNDHFVKSEVNRTRIEGAWKAIVLSVLKSNSSSLVQKVSEQGSEGLSSKMHASLLSKMCLYLVKDDAYEVEMLKIVISSIGFRKSLQAVCEDKGVHMAWKSFSLEFISEMEGKEPTRVDALVKSILLNSKMKFDHDVNVKLTKAVCHRKSTEDLVDFMVGLKEGQNALEIISWAIGVAKSGAIGLQVDMLSLLVQNGKKKPEKIRLTYPKLQVLVTNFTALKDRQDLAFTEVLETVITSLHELALRHIQGHPEKDSVIDFAKIVFSLLNEDDSKFSDVSFIYSALRAIVTHENGAEGKQYELTSINDAVGDLAQLSSKQMSLTGEDMMIFVDTLVFLVAQNPRLTALCSISLYLTIIESATIFPVYLVSQKSNEIVDLIIRPILTDGPLQSTGDEDDEIEEDHGPDDGEESGSDNDESGSEKEAHEAKKPRISDSDMQKASKVAATLETEDFLNDDNENDIASDNQEYDDKLSEFVMALLSSKQQKKAEKNSLEEETYKFRIRLLSLLYIVAAAKTSSHDTVPLTLLTALAKIVSISSTEKASKNKIDAKGVKKQQIVQHETLFKRLSEVISLSAASANISSLEAKSGMEKLTSMIYGDNDGEKIGKAKLQKLTLAIGDLISCYASRLPQPDIEKYFALFWTNVLTQKKPNLPVTVLIRMAERTRSLENSNIFLGCLKQLISSLHTEQKIIGNNLATSLSAINSSINVLGDIDENLKPLLINVCETVVELSTLVSGKLKLKQSELNVCLRILSTIGTMPQALAQTLATLVTNKRLSQHHVIQSIASLLKKTGYEELASNVLLVVGLSKKGKHDKKQERKRKRKELNKKERSNEKETDETDKQNVEDEMDVDLDKSEAADSESMDEE